MGAVHVTEVQPFTPFTALNFLEHPVLEAEIPLGDIFSCFFIRQFGEVSSEHLPAFLRLAATVKQWLGTDACQSTLG